VILVNGTPVPEDKATVPALDAGFLYGETVFTTVGIVDRTPLFLDRHIARLARMASEAGIASCPGVDALAAGVRTMIGIHDPPPRLLRITVTPGSLSAAAIDRRPETPGAWYVFPIFRPDPDPGLYDAGVPVELGPPLALPAGDPRSRLKTGNLFLSRWLRLRKRPECAEILLSGRSGRIVEGTVSNVFFVEDSGTVLTPPESWGVLPGVIRAVVLETLGEAGRSVRFGAPTRRSLEGIREIVLTNSFIGALPVSRILPPEGDSAGSEPVWSLATAPELSRTLKAALDRKIRSEREAWRNTHPAGLQVRKSPD
jgi:branched-subunit amino acid aminotransferase/4-amino-4-deoxychorismate lyase